MNSSLRAMRQPAWILSVWRSRSRFAGSYNAGRDGSVVVDTVKKSPPGVGYDAEADDFGDMMKKGIIDQTKVVRSALENASSIAAMVLVTEALVADIPEKKKMPAMPGGGMGGMEGML